MATIQQHHIKALTPTWLLVKVSTAPPRDGSAKKPAPAAAYSPLLLSPSAWQKAQDEKKSKNAGLPASPRISCMGRVKGRRKGCSSARGPQPQARGSSHGGVLATLVLGLFGRRNRRTSRACSKVRDVPRGGSASAPGSSHGGNGMAAATECVLDPPLPVVRQLVRGDDAPSLWERRRGGGNALEGLSATIHRYGVKLTAAAAHHNSNFVQV